MQVKYIDNFHEVNLSEGPLTNNDVKEEKNTNKQQNIKEEQTNNNINYKKQNCCFKKNIKIIVSIIASIILITGVVLLIVFVGLKKSDDSKDKIEPSNSNSIINPLNIDDSSQNNNSEEEDEFIILPNNEKIITKLSYNINELFIYNEQSNTTMTYNYDPDSSLRRLTETITTVKNYKYLSYIYDIKNTSDGIEQYSAYFTILEKFTEENGENNYDFYNNFIEMNVDELNENSDSSEMMSEEFKIKPILKAIFYQNGTIGDILYPEGVNDDLKLNVINFIEKITPILSQKNYTKGISRLLDNSEENKHTLTYEKDNGSTKLNEKQVEKNKDYGTFSIEDSKINSNIERIINSDNKIGKIISNSETNLISNISNQIEKPNYGGLVDLNEDKGDENNVIKFPIDSVSTNNSESMELIENHQNETLKEFFNTYTKEYKYISTKKINNENNARILSKLFNVNPNDIHPINDSNTKYINNINDLRNLDSDKYNVLQQQINYAFSLAKTNAAGFKFGIMAVMSFSPQNGKITFKVICRTDKEEIILGNYTISTNYDKLIDVIYKISYIYQNKITLLFEEFNNKFDTWKKNIRNNLKTLTNNVKDPYNMVDIFSSPLSELYNNIREISLDNFSGIKNDIKIVDNNLSTIKEELINNKENNTQKILSTSNSDFLTFIQDTDELLNDFQEKTLNTLNEILSQLNDVEDSIDIDTYYRIIEMLNETYYEYEKFSKKLSNAISKNKEDFISYSNNYKDSKLENILSELEYIANKLNTNETYKESMKDEDRLNMIKSLNNYRKTIDDMLDLIYNKINNLYNILLEDNQGVYNQILENVQTKIKEFKEKQNETLTKVRGFMNLTDDFEIYSKHLRILDSIHEKCIFNRIKLMSIYFTYPISNLEDTYLTNDVIKTFSEELDVLSLDIINNIKNNNPITDSLNVYKSKFESILKDIYGDNLISKYIDIYTNKTFLNEKERGFYDKLFPFYMEYNTTFYEQYFKLDFKKYVDKPIEIITKFTQIAEIQKNYFHNPAGEINEIIYNILSDLITKAYENYLNIVKKDYNIISATLDKTNSVLVEEVNNFFNNLYSKIESEKNTKRAQSYIKNILNLSDDPFGLKSLAEENEKELYTYKILEIRENVRTKFILHFCENGDTIETCNHDILNLVDKHNYNMAKVRNEIEHYLMIPNYAKDLLTDDLLVDLNGNKFLNLFLEKADFGVDSVKNEILNFIKKKNDEEYEIFNPYIEKFKTSYIEVFETNLNTQLITNKLEILASLIFTNKLKINNTNYETLIDNELKTFKSKWVGLNFYLNSASFQNSFDSLYNNLKNVLYTYNNFVDNLILDESIIKSTSDYYKSIFDNGHSEILKKIFEISNIYENFNLLNITLNLNDIGKQAMKELKETYYSHIESETKRIYDLKFNELKSNIKDYINKQVNNILTKLNTEFESNYLNLSIASNPDCQKTEMTPESDDKCKNRSKVQLTSLDNQLISSINNYANTYKTHIENIFSQSAINNQIIKFENGNKTSQLKQTYNFDEIENKITQNANNLKKICEENLEKEKAEFKTEINDVIENEFKNIVTNFANGYGINFMTDIYNKIYTYSLKIQYNFFNKILTNAHSYVKDTLFSKIDKIEENLKDSILNVYNNTHINIQTNSQNNINEKLTNSFNNLIENSNSIIVNKFSEIILNAINNENYISTFSSIIYELIPKEFTYSFNLLLKDDYSNIIKNINLNNLVSLFTQSINSDISNIKNLLNSQKSQMIDLFSSKTISGTKTEILAILNKISSFKSSNIFITFQNDYEFLNSEEKKNYLISFIDQKIYSSINIIFNSYNNIDSDKSSQIQTLLDNFKDYSQFVINNLNSETIIQESQNALNSLKNTIESEILDYLLNSFKDLDLLITNDNTIDLTLKKENKNNRNLVDVNINKIQEAFNLYKNSYLNNTSQLNSSTEIINLQKEFSNFKSILQNSVINVGNPITNYLDVFKGYLTQSQLLSFSNKLKNQLENIKTNVNNFITNESTIIDESLKLVKNILPQLFNSNKDALKSSIDSSLLKLYDIILPNVNKVDSSESKTKKDIKLGSYKAVLPGNVKHTFSSFTKSFNYQNKIKLIYNNDYTFSVIMSTSNIVQLNKNFDSGGIRGGFDGTVADIKITVSALNNFAIERVDFEAKNENKGANYNNWIQYQKKECFKIKIGKIKIKTHWFCKYRWDTPTYSTYRETKASNNNFKKTYMN